jgi:predicted MFS family arabinose efflux permease
MLAAAGGGLLTAVIGSRWGRQLSIAVAGVLTVAPLVLLGGTLQLWQYAIAAMLVPTANTFGIAYQMGFVAQNDVTGRLSSLTAAVVALASMACTITGGILLDADGYPALYWFIAALIGSSVLIFLHLTRRKHRHNT